MQPLRPIVFYIVFAYFFRDVSLNSRTQAIHTAQSMSLSSYSSPEHAISLQGGSRGGQLRVHNSYRPLVSQVPMSELEHNIHPNRLYNHSQHQVLGNRPLFPDDQRGGQVIGHGYNNRASRPVRTSVVVGRIPAGGSTTSNHDRGDNDYGSGRRGTAVTEHLQAVMQSGEHGPAGAGSDDYGAGSVRPEPYDYGDDRQGAAPLKQVVQPPTSGGGDSNAAPRPTTTTAAAQGAPPPPPPPDVTPIKCVQQPPVTSQHARPVPHHPAPGAAAGVPPTHDHSAAVENLHTSAIAAAPQQATPGIQGGTVPSTSAGVTELCGHRFSRPGDKFCAECGDSLDWYCAGARGVVQQPIPPAMVRLSNSSSGPSVMASAPYRPVVTWEEPEQTQLYHSHLLAYNEQTRSPLRYRNNTSYTGVGIGSDDAAHYRLGGYGPVPTFRGVYDGQGPVMSPSRSHTACTCSFH
jgi:hypothetical protein